MVRKKRERKNNFFLLSFLLFFFFYLSGGSKANERTGRNPITEKFSIEIPAEYLGTGEEADDDYIFDAELQVLFERRGYIRYIPH